jgi:hypothetical protein
MESVEELKQRLNKLKKVLIVEREERKENPKTIETLKSRLRAVEDSISKSVYII